MTKMSFWHETLRKLVRKKPRIELKVLRFGRRKLQVLEWNLNDSKMETSYLLILPCMSKGIVDEKEIISWKLKGSLNHESIILKSQDLKVERNLLSKRKKCF